VLLAAGGGLGLAAGAAFRRIAREIDEERRHLDDGGSGTPPPAGTDG